MMCPILSKNNPETGMIWIDCVRQNCEWWVKDPFDKHVNTCVAKMIALVLASPLNVYVAD